MQDEFTFQPKEDISYYGSSDLIGQIADELRNCPMSCFSQNVFSWYDDAYASEQGEGECGYQVKINQELCEEGEDDAPETLTDVIDIIAGFVEGSPRRVARAAVRVICREALRRVTERTAPNVLPQE